jgi:transposase
MAKKKQPDKKLQALKAHSCLNPRAKQVIDALFREDAFFDPRDMVQVKYEMLRKVDVDKQPVTEAAQSFGFSRPSFYKAKETFEQEGLMGLVPKKRGPRTRHKVSEVILNFVKEVLQKQGRLPMVEVAARVEKRFGVKIHPRSLERALTGKKKSR